MNGVIIFADDKIFETDSPENKLFNEFNKENDYPVIPIDSIEKLEKAILSISTCRALILDWEFIRKEEDLELEGAEVPSENPLNILEKNKIFTLIYIYSQKEISPEIQQDLIELYPNKISFRQKEGNDAQKEYETILTEIISFEEKNKHLNVPSSWSQDVNISVQSIFKELEEADPKWIREIYKTAEEDGSSPEVEVTNIFFNLLNEYLIQQKSFSSALKDYIETEIKEDNGSEVKQKKGKLYQRIFYTKLTKDSSFMTGDIFKFSENKYGILITPDCDIKKRIEKHLDFLCFNKDDYNVFLKKKGYQKSDFSTLSETKKQKLKDSLLKDFNNHAQKCQVLPSFPFNSNIFNQTAIIDFKESLYVIKNEEFMNKRTDYKLNTPYIHQLRQRFLSYVGRIGVPAIPQNLKLYNLEMEDK